MQEVTRHRPAHAAAAGGDPRARWGPRRGGSTSKSPPRPEAGELQGLSAPAAPLGAGAGLGSRQGPPSPPPTGRLLHLPPVTVAFCFLGDTRIRRCVRVTNLLQAGQLSQGGLTGRAGKADTLGQCWQARAPGRSGPLGLQAPPAGRGADPASGGPEIRSRSCPCDLGAWA